VLAICHEVGNLLAAVRLSSHLLPYKDEEDKGMAETLEDLAAQAGTLLAHVRPLLGDDPKSRIRVSPSNVLVAVARALHEDSNHSPAPEVQAPEGLPEVQVDPDALHHVLITLVRSTRGSGEDGRAVVSARREGRRVVFTVRDGAARTPARRDSAAGAPRGRALALQIARALVLRDRGVISIRSVSGGAEVGLAFPVLPKMRPRGKRRRRPAVGRRRG
jgi:hypothetical protein